MRWYFVVIVGFGLAGCSTGSMKARMVDPAESEVTTTFDGTTDSIDSLPECIPELAGSLYWVRSDKAGYDCTMDGEWIARPYIEAPGPEN